MLEIRSVMDWKGSKGAFRGEGNVLCLDLSVLLHGHVVFVKNPLQFPYSSVCVCVSWSVMSNVLQRHGL